MHVTAESHPAAVCAVKTELPRRLDNTSHNSHQRNFLEADWSLASPL